LKQIALKHLIFLPAAPVLSPGFFAASKVFLKNPYTRLLDFDILTIPKIPVAFYTAGCIFTQLTVEF
jgi:hypothetical protein